jgi:hypothetical protein
MGVFAKSEQNETRTLREFVEGPHEAVRSTLWMGRRCRSDGHAI